MFLTIPAIKKDKKKNKFCKQSISSNFPFPQMKWCAIISYKHGVHELHHKLPNESI